MSDSIDLVFDSQSDRDKAFEVYGGYLQEIKYKENHPPPLTMAVLKEHLAEVSGRLASSNLPIKKKVA